MVSGCAIAVTAVPGTNQCAEITAILRGRGSDAPSAFQARLNGVSVMAFIGLPWPTYTAGKRGCWGIV
jgi:hypothetical protein